ncbi:MAG TPA: GDSL-type esterase/lipase family protein [Solirubrobacteraceae bacterium]|nr:GDSL-type esterase/lipase family protein [Solirubrobacteraceae bacterium]
MRSTTPSQRTRARGTGGRAAGIAATVLAALALALLPTGTGHASTASACPSHWVVSWGASPSDASQTQTLDDQTLRMIVAPHFGGSEVRVRLSNEFGSAPVTLGSVYVGLSSGGAGVQDGTNQQVTFAGQSSVTISAGAQVASDPVTLAVTPFQDLAVSVYVPGAIPNPTEHEVTRQTSFMSAPESGDVGADTDGGIFPSATGGQISTGWYFLDGIDVLAPATARAVVAFGDSLTDGFQGNLLTLTENDSTVNQNARYPDDLARRLLAAGLPLSVLDAGISGNELLTSGTANQPFGGPSGLTRLAQDALDIPGASDLIVFEGINDLAASGASAGQVIAGLTQVVQQAHAAGLRVQLATLTPTGASLNSSYSSAATTAAREQVNQWILGQHIADGVIDFASAVADPSDPAELSPQYDGGDGIHLNAAGYRALANAVSLSALAAPTCQPAAAPAARCPRATQITLPRRYARTLRSWVVLDGRRVLARAGSRRHSVAVDLHGRAATLQIVAHLRGRRTVRVTRHVPACGG